jgi:hypothetical protein
MDEAAPISEDGLDIAHACDTLKGVIETGSLGIGRCQSLSDVPAASD